MTEAAMRKQRERPQINIKFGDGEEDKVVYEWLKSRPGGVTAYIRRLIRYDMEWTRAKEEYEGGKQ